MHNIRLTDSEITSIHQCFKNRFLDTDNLWLFGSRVDTNAKGGDIDLYIETNINDVQEVLDKKLAFVADVQDKIGEQKIDVVINYSGSKELPIYKIAKQRGVKII